MSKLLLIYLIDFDLSSENIHTYVRSNIVWDNKTPYLSKFQFIK